MSLCTTPSTSTQPIHFELRLATERDISFAQQLTSDNMAPYYQHAGIQWDSADFAESWRLTFNVIVIAPSAQQAQRMGLVRLHLDQSEAILWELQLLPQYQRQGLGSRVLERALNACKQSGCKKIVLDVYKSNPAVSLYRRAGFQIDSQNQYEFKMSRILS